MTLVNINLCLRTVRNSVGTGSVINGNIDKIMAKSRTSADSNP